MPEKHRITLEPGTGASANGYWARVAVHGGPNACNVWAPTKQAALIELDKHVRNSPRFFKDIYDPKPFRNS